MLRMVAVAEQIVMGYFESDEVLDSECKSGGSPVTQADIEAQAAIQAIAMELYPTYSFYGEEGSEAAHAKGIWVMVDVVANHSGPIGTDFGQLYPLNQSYHYHDNCDIDWSNQWSVENCRLAGLPDLDQSNSYVRQYLKDWVKNIVETYDFDGIRIDTIPEVPKDFWAEYGQSAGVFQMGECFNGDPAYVGPYQGSLTALFNYPMYYTIADVFGSHQSMYKIRNRYNAEASYFSDIDALGVFVDNHDNPRFLNRYSNNKTGLK